LGDHHDPAADAVAAAGIGIHVLGDEPTWFQVAEAMRVNLGRVTADSWSGCHSKDLRYLVPTEPSEGVEVNPGHPLFGKTVAFTGELAVRRRDAQQAAVNVGAVAGKGVTRSTDYLVAGFQDLSRLAQGESKSAKFRKAESLRSDGFPCEIITESEFVGLLNDQDAGRNSGERLPRR